MGIGIPAAGLFYWGLISFLGDDDDESAYWIPMAIGALPYAITLFWDGIGGVYHVKQHNKNYKTRQDSRLPTVWPILSASGDGIFTGVQIMF